MLYDSWLSIANACFISQNMRFEKLSDSQCNLHDHSKSLKGAISAIQSAT